MHLRPDGIHQPVTQLATAGRISRMQIDIRITKHQRHHISDKAHPLFGLCVTAGDTGNHCPEIA